MRSTEGAENETPSSTSHFAPLQQVPPKASRGRKMGRGIPLPSRPEGLGHLERSFEIINTILQFDYLSFSSDDAMRARYMLYGPVSVSV